jgi:hypothetical protein
MLNLEEIVEHALLVDLDTSIFHYESQALGLVVIYTLFRGDRAVGRIHTDADENLILEDVNFDPQIGCSDRDWRRFSATISDEWDRERERRASIAEYKRKKAGGGIILRLGKPGRKRDPYYDEAAQRIRDGQSYDKVFEWWCQVTETAKPDKGVRDSFKQAIKRRQNNS